MNARERAVVDALLPAGARPGLPGALETGFEEFYARFLREAVPALRLGCAAALFAAAWLSPLLIRRLPPLTRLSPQEREAALEAMARSRFYPLRQLLLVLKMVVCLHYGAQEAPRRAVGFPS